MSPENALSTYCAAFAEQDQQTIVELFAPNGLYEIPFLKNRLVGHAEIAAGLGAMFAIVELGAMNLTKVRSDDILAIGEGR